MDDLISLQAAIDVLHGYFDGMLDTDTVCPADIYGLFECIPSEQPEPHKGHWIKHETPDGGEQYECSRCGVLWEFNDGTPEDNEAYFCPKCGTRMKRRGE